MGLVNCAHGVSSCNPCLFLKQSSASELNLLGSAMSFKTNIVASIQCKGKTEHVAIHRDKKQFCVWLSTWTYSFFFFSFKESVFFLGCTKGCGPWDLSSPPKDGICSGSMDYNHQTAWKFPKFDFLKNIMFCLDKTKCTAGLHLQ